MLMYVSKEISLEGCKPSWLQDFRQVKELCAWEMGDRRRPFLQQAV